MMKLRSAGATCLFVLGVNVLSAQGVPPPGNNQAGNAQDRINAVNQSIFGRVNQTPWFMNEATRNMLKINEDQAKRLNDSYAQFWTVYNRNTTPFNNSFTLNDTQRQRMLTSTNQFYVDFGRSANEILSPEQRARFYQLGYQYRGYGALYDPTITEWLRLSNDQLTQLRRYENDYNSSLAEYYKARNADPANAALKFEELQKELNERITSVLSAQQRDAWKQIVGEPYRFRIN